MKDLDRELLLDLCTTEKTNPRIEDDDLIVACTLADGSVVELSLNVSGDTFYRLPEFSVSLEHYSYLKGLPHIGSNGIICASDATISQPNPKKPEKCVSEILGKAITVLDEGITGVNHADYADEINAYWAIDSTRFAYICDVLPAETNTIYVAFAKVGRRAVPCFATSAQAAVEYSKRLGDYDNHTVKARPCLFLSLIRPLSFPLPSTYKDWDNEIGRSSIRAQREYRTFLSQSKSDEVFIVLGVPANSGKAIVCFRQEATPKYTGFRSHSKRHKCALKNPSYGEKVVKKYCLQDISQERLFTRGGNGNIVQGVAGVIGCGSLGSNLSTILADAGLSRLLLIDNEVLSIENIARHACGFDYVGKSKSEAIQRMLEDSNPNMRCIAIKTDANKIIDESPQMLNNCQAVFITAADGPLEYHFVSAFCNSELTCPLIIIWIEPFALAGHAIVLNKPQDIYCDLFDENLSFVNPVILNSKKFLRREAGCQSTYMPYSGLDEQIFLQRFIKAWISNSGIETTHNYHFKWIGSLSESRMLGAVVAPEYAELPDYSCSVERID